MRDKDDRLMEEAFDEIQEGILDRMKGGFASTKAGFDAAGGIGKGLMGRGKRGIIQGLGGNLNTKDRNQNMAEQKAKANALIASYAKKLKELAVEANVALEKLQVDGSMIEDRIAVDAIKLLARGEYPNKQG